MDWPPTLSAHMRTAPLRLLPHPTPPHLCHRRPSSAPVGSSNAEALVQGANCAVKLGSDTTKALATADVSDSIMLADIDSDRKQPTALIAAVAGAGVALLLAGFATGMYVRHRRKQQQREAHDATQRSKPGDSRSVHITMLPPPGADTTQGASHAMDTPAAVGRLPADPLPQHMPRLPAEPMLGQGPRLPAGPAAGLLAAPQPAAQQWSGAQHGISRI
jgi:hypothetical protein